jgi:hypothetical protein
MIRPEAFAQPCDGYGFGRIEQSARFSGETCEPPIRQEASRKFTPDQAAQAITKASTLGKPPR